MKPYEFYRAESVEAAVASGAAGARDFAGGTNLIDLMKLQVETPGALVDIGRIGLDAVEEADGGVRIGALVPNSDLAAHPPDMAVAMLALDAVVVTKRAGREGRRMPLGELYRLPGDTPEIETILDPGELIVALALPQPPPGSRSAVSRPIRGAILRSRRRWAVSRPGRQRSKRRRMRCSRKRAVTAITISRSSSRVAR